MRQTLRRASLGMATASLLLVGVEGGLRTAGLPDPGLYEGDRATVWWTRRNLERVVPASLGRPEFRIRTNALGLRGPLPPEGDWTLALGCSTTFGWGVEAEEAWPAQLADRLDEPVVNGGVPGWSSHQARMGAKRYLDAGPSRVILGYFVRDAWQAVQPDAQARPTPWPLRLAIGRLLGGLATPKAALGTAALSVGLPNEARVPPQAFAENLLALAAQAAPAEVWLLAFPTHDRAGLAPWLDAMHSTGLPVMDPSLTPDAFFPEDTVHLTPAGHRSLALDLAEVLRGPPAAGPAD